MCVSFNNVIGFEINIFFLKLFLKIPKRTSCPTVCIKNNEFYLDYYYLLFYKQTYMMFQTLVNICFKTPGLEFGPGKKKSEMNKHTK